ncbi:glycoside hydrolase family 18 protein [Collybiopsis luxurians FD-317 M1]|uniref:chitinase n=1 Tax=Collybiopsis luxurians FD-317 M1 TaxID=944289 RepID=A0A0D0CD97_9AGAR|nr:glycoside hydrolase family 18 protein [Collybiopsis luxurians FD-317 M1]
MRLSYLRAGSFLLLLPLLSHLIAAMPIGLAPRASSPGHRVVVYYQTQYQSNKYISPTPLTSLASHLIIAAFHLNDDKTIHLNDVPPSDPSLVQMWKDVASMQASGVKAMGMLGGAAQGSYANLAKDFDTFYQLLAGTITQYKLDGIDLDIEEPESLENVAKLIQKLRADFGTGFIITLAPVANSLQGSSNHISGFSYSDLEKSYGSQIDWYNAQFYSGFGSMSSTQDYDDIVKDLPLDPSRLVAGTLTNPGDGSGYVPLVLVENTVRELVGEYQGSFGGVAGWEYFNSEPNPNQPWGWASTMKATMNN